MDFYHKYGKYSKFDFLRIKKQTKDVPKMVIPEKFTMVSLDQEQGERKKSKIKTKIFTDNDTINSGHFESSNIRTFDKTTEQCARKPKLDYILEAKEPNYKELLRTEYEGNTLLKNASCPKIQGLDKFKSLENDLMRSFNKQLLTGSKSSAMLKPRQETVLPALRPHLNKLNESHRSRQIKRDAKFTEKGKIYRW